MDPQNIQEIGTIGLAVYVLVEIFKRAGFPSRFAPLLSLIFGLGIGAISYMLIDKVWYEGLIAGFWAAASASGVYSGTKAVLAPKSFSYEDDPALHPPC